MSTTPSVITAPSGPPLSNLEQIRAAASEPEPSQAATETPVESAPETQTEPEPQSQPEVSEPGEQAEVQAEAPAAEPEMAEEANPYDQLEEAEFPPQTLAEILRSPDGKRMYANDKALRGIGKAIGHVPTVEQATEYYEAFRRQTLMDGDLTSGNPKQAERLITHLFNPQRGEGAHIVAAQFGPTLQKSNPEAYEAAAKPFLSNYGNALWSRFEDMPDPPRWEGSVKQAIYNAAQALHKDLNGKYREITGGQAQPAGQAQADTAVAQRQADLDAREQRVTQAEQTAQQQATRQRDQAVATKLSDALDAELDKALAKAKEHHQKTPRLYNALKKEFREVVEKAPVNQQAWDIFQVNLGKAKRSGSPEAIEAVAKEYVRLASAAIIANRKQFLEEAGLAAVAVNDSKNSELRSIDSHKAPSNGGAAPKPIAGQPLTRNAGESQTAFNLRLLRS